ncbi:MAG: cytochrome b/b6 domain-containing protein [Cypionkella sp.]
MQARHSRVTKGLHATLAIAVGAALFSSLILQEPDPFHPENGFFELHQAATVLASVTALGLWLSIFTRRTGTAAGALLPWFSAARRDSLRADALRQGRALARGYLPPFIPAAPLSTAAQGLGLIVVTAMALSGAFACLALHNAGISARFAAFTMQLHWGLTALTWAFFIGHTAFAVLLHLAGDQNLGVIWRFRQPPQTKGPHP